MEMPHGLWMRVRSRKRKEGWDKEGQVVLPNTVSSGTALDRSGLSAVLSKRAAEGL